MPETTKRVPADRLRQYFDDFSKRFLRDDVPETADIEILSTEFGDQLAVKGIHLAGVTFDPNSSELDIFLDSGEHRIYSPKEVWTIEEPDGFISAIEVVRSDGTKEVLQLNRANGKAGGTEGNGAVRRPADASSRPESNA